MLGRETPEGLDGVTFLPTLTREGDAPARNPMVWVFPEYGGQVAVRFDEWKLLRRGLRRSAGPEAWELYDVVDDRSEQSDVAAEHPDVVARGIAILEREADENELFPVPLATLPQWLAPGSNRIAKYAPIPQP